MCTHVSTNRCKGKCHFDRNVVLINTNLMQFESLSVFFTELFVAINVDVCRFFFLKTLLCGFSSAGVLASITRDI